MTTRPKTIDCERCGAGVQVRSRGPVPRYCAACRKFGSQGPVVGDHRSEPWRDSREAQARARSNGGHSPNGNGAQPALEPMGEPVVLDTPVTVPERSVYQSHHRKNRAKRTALTLLWLVAAVLILAVAYVVIRGPAFAQGAAFLDG